MPCVHGACERVRLVLPPPPVALHTVCYTFRPKHSHRRSRSRMKNIRGDGQKMRRGN
jgi:hypothetical protein